MVPDRVAMQSWRSEYDKLKNFLSQDAGATAIEYGLIAGAMAVVLVAAFPTLSNALSGKLTSVASMFPK